MFYLTLTMPRADISALTKLVYLLTSQWRRHLWRNVVAVLSSSKGPLKGKHLLFLHWFVMKSFRCRAVFYTPHLSNNIENVTFTWSAGFSNVLFVTITEINSLFTFLSVYITRGNGYLHPEIWLSNTQEYGFFMTGLLTNQKLL